MALKQLTLATEVDAGFALHRKATKRDLFLAEMDQVVPWSALCALIEPHSAASRLQIRDVFFWLCMTLAVSVIGTGVARAATGYIAGPYQQNGFPPYIYYSTIGAAADANFNSVVAYYHLVGCTYDLVPVPFNSANTVAQVVFQGDSSCTSQNEGVGRVVIGEFYYNDPYKNMGCSEGCQAGDPINLATGSEYEEQHDYLSIGLLKFDRYYNSDRAVDSPHIGAHWRHTYDRSIEYLFGESSPVAMVFRADGKEVKFQKMGGVWTADPDINDTLLENDDANGQIQGWTFFDAATQHFENYDTNGLLTSIQNLSGQVTTLTYSDASTPTSIAPAPGLLITVTDPSGRQLQFIYDASSQITQITLPIGGTLAYTYDTSGNMTQVTYPDGHTRVYKYDESSNVWGSPPNTLTGIIDENGQRYADIQYDGASVSSSQIGGVSDLITVQYNAYNSGKPMVTWPLGVQSLVGFTTPNGRFRVSSNSQPCGPSCNQAAASRTYDSNGNPASSTDFNGVTTAYTYDANGLETQRIEAQGTPVQRTISTTWDTVFRNPLDRQVLDASGTLTAKTDWVYNANGQTVARCEDDPTVSGATGYACSITTTPPKGVRRWVYTYCNAVGSGCPLVGLLLSVKGPRGDMTRYAYYTSTSLTACGAPGGVCHHLGDLWKVTDALGHVTTTVSYDKDGRPTETKDPNGVVSTFSYSPRGWLQTRTVAGAQTTITYDAVGNVIKVTQPDGVYTSYGYDTAHRLTDIYDALGNHVHFTLDEAGNRTAENTYPSGSSTASRSLSRAYNTLGQLVKSLDAYGNATAYGYDSDGNQTDMTDPLGIKTHQSYDALNRLSQTVRNYLGSDSATANTTTAYAYDSHNNVSEVTDPDGLNTHYSYSGLNDLNQLLSPDTGTTTYTHDAAGNRISRTDARHVITHYSYDLLNRLTLKSYPTASLDVHYYHDQANSKTGCTSSDPIGRLTEMTDATGSTMYCYDAHGNMILKRQIIGTATYTTAYSWNAADRLIGVTYPDGATVTYTRDADGRIASVSATPVGGINTTIVSAIGYLPFGPATDYTFADGGQSLGKLYDANYRATDIEGSALNLHFTLNAMGDITAEGNAAGVPTPNETYLYDPLYRLQQVDDATGAPWQTYSYNETGDRLGKAMAGLGPDTYNYQSGTHRLLSIGGYDVSNRAVDANGNTTAFQANGWTYGLGYDNTNRLTLIQQNGSTVATYGLTGQGERVAKTLAGGGTQVYAYDEAGHLLGEYATGQSRDYVWADGTLVAVLDNPAQGGDAIHYVYTDNLGTPRSVTTQSGTLVWDWPYNQNPFGEAPASGSGYTLNLRYPGQYFDQEDGLNYNYFRDYEPATGRYAQSDPTGLEGGISTYAYVTNNPIGEFDPLGLCGDDNKQHCEDLLQIDTDTCNAITRRRGAAAGAACHASATERYAACLRGRALPPLNTWNSRQGLSPLDWQYWEQVTGLSGGALATYLIISEGSRLFPPRDFVPIP